MRTSRPDLNFWIRRAAREYKKAKQKPSPATIHHLRVAVRRCRSIAQGLLLTNPQETAYQKINQLGKKLLKKLGGLRDVQVKIKWASFLFHDEERSQKRIIRLLKKRERGEIKRVRKYLKKFDIEAWENLVQNRMTQVRAGQISPVAIQRIVRRLALKVRNLDQAVKKNPRQAFYHRLRIAFKKYRYFTNHFFPHKKKKIERTLTRIQTALGNAHDLEELVDRVGRFKRKVGKSKASQLKKHIQKIKTKNLERYRDIVEQTQILSQI